jgi:hypothetical protein
MYVVWVRVGDACGLSLVACRLSSFKIDRLRQVFCYLSVSHIFCPSFWHVSMVFEVH